MKSESIVNEFLSKVGGLSRGLSPPSQCSFDSTQVSERAGAWVADHSLLPVADLCFEKRHE